jgi:hypothetical protein
VFIDRIAGVFVLALIVIACLPFTFSLIHDPIARAVLLVIGIGAITGRLVFVLIGRHFRQWFDRWRLTRHLAAAARRAATARSASTRRDSRLRQGRSSTMIIDTSALVAVLDQEPEAERIVRTLASAPKRLLSAANLV